MLLLFPDPFWLSPGDRTCPEEPVDRRSFRRNQNKKIKAKKKKEFYFKNRYVGCCFFFFPFCIQYIVIQTSQYYIQIHNIFKKAYF